MFKNNSRKLKCLTECLEKKFDSTIHPIYAIPISNDGSHGCGINKIGLDFEGLYGPCDKYEPITKEEMIQQFNIPHININEEVLLSYYNVTDIESLANYVDEKIEDMYYDSINRIINLWIKVNLENLKNYNQALFPILKEVILKFTNVSEKDINKELGKFTSYWVNSKNLTDFNFNLIHDFKKYLSKKYGRKKK